MKRLAFIMTALLLALMPASAQHYRDSRYYNKHTGRLDYGYNHHGYGVPYLETGLSYIEKGGKKDLANGKKMTYDLNYLEIPAVIKYKYEVDDHFSLQPFMGGYFAVGVGGKIKNFAEREAESSFDSHNFRRLDGGLRIGCGISYDMFYADLTYDIGLANICHDTFDRSRNGAVMFNFGVNF